jgi:hypothetical protein
LIERGYVIDDGDALHGQRTKSGSHEASRIVWIIGSHPDSKSKLVEVLQPVKPDPVGAHPPAFPACPPQTGNVSKSGRNPPWLRLTDGLCSGQGGEETYSSDAHLIPSISNFAVHLVDALLPFLVIRVRGHANDVDGGALGWPPQAL